MQRASILCSSSPLLPTFPPTTHKLAAASLQTRHLRLDSVSSPLRLPLNPLHSYRLALPPLHSTATEEIVETAEAESGFVSVGYVANVHGLQGEIRVKPSTDFPELRFAEPGRRWLRQQSLGQERVQEVELVEGRGHPGQKSWILKLRGIDDVDQARQLIGSTLLVREEDRPQLEDGEIYTRDLVGMRVILKETGKPVGNVVNVFNSGASDLLQVMLDSSFNILDSTGKPKPAGTTLSGHLVLIPFVEEIVPDVDIKRKEMQITPPKGLLELNLRFDERSKKERRQIEWKERKKSQKRLIAAKKKLCEMDQKHVFDGLRFGEKAQRSLLADQIVSVNSLLLQQALDNVEIHSKRLNVTEMVSVLKAEETSSTLEISEKCLISSASEDKLGTHFHYQQTGVDLISKGKVAIALVVNNSDDPENSMVSFQTLLCDDQRFVKMEDRASVPLILVCSAQKIDSLRMHFSENDYFGFDSEKVQFFEEEKLPVVSSSVEDEKKHKILMKSPWEILQSPVGSGGVFSLLSSNNVPENLSEMGVEYIEICSSHPRNISPNSLLLGFVNTSKADIGIQIFKDTNDYEESFNMIFTTDYMKKLTKQLDKLQFSATTKQNAHVEMVDKEWVDVNPSSPNSYEFDCTIYSSLKACSFDKLCIMEVTK
ncbi:PREDICTED: uncharacterized protein LOC101308845 [Fragaria vesca subsp. vesca]|uniref:uncharacterized protein LOC101308845 n=1 Tax=Fragaria vesca subsp. vesca TaxID=101020 RepID=UPI0002C3239C|nr:PREDICTED: uncharacterized protein LOC101308845 [Fragaria vesca subsp. vesca]